MLHQIIRPRIPAVLFISTLSSVFTILKLKLYSVVPGVGFLNYFKTFPAISIDIRLELN